MLPVKKHSLAPLLAIMVLFKLKLTGALPPAHICLVCIDHDGRPRAGALVTTEGRICDLQDIGQGEDRATRIGAISSRSSTSDASCYENVKESTVVHPHDAAVVEYGAAQRPASTAAGASARPPNGPPLPGRLEHRKNAALPQLHRPLQSHRLRHPLEPGATTTAETAVTTLGCAATTAAAVATAATIREQKKVLNRFH